MVNASIQTTLLPLRFGEGFFDDYAGKLITDPHVAVIELVANSWDAGAQHVTLTWPSEIKGKFGSVETPVKGDRSKSLFAPC